MPEGEPIETRTAETEPQPKPWEGQVYGFYPPTEVRVRIRDDVYEMLGSDGMWGTNLGGRLAEAHYRSTEEGVDVLYKESDAILEISRMVGTSLRMAPDAKLYVSREWREKRRQGYAAKT
ncbi:MAG TPA: hypothetical protein VGA08_02000 [Candidatus Saccharimonadales bacterium]